MEQEPTLAQPPGFAMHKQIEWKRQAQERREWDAWLRVAALAYGTHRRNGHSPFATGEISRLLKISRAATVSDAIRKAIEFGMLDRKSTARCLVVRPHMVTGGQYGAPNEPCPVHGHGLVFTLPA